MKDCIPPNDIETERALLGSILLDNRNMQPVDASAYYLTAHGEIAKAIYALIAKGQPADIVTVTAWLRERDSIEKAGGAAYIGDLTNCAINPRNCGEYARIVNEHAGRRELICRGIKLVNDAFSADLSLDELCNGFHAAANDVQPKSKHLKHVKDVGLTVINQLEKLYEQEEEPGISTGFHILNKYIRFHPGEQTIIAGRPGMGKTSFALDLTRAAIFDGHRVLWASLEMTNERLVQRLLSALSGIEGTKFNTAKFADSDWPKLTAALGKLVNTNLWMDDSGGIGSGHIAAVANRISAEHGPLGLIVVDYAQIMKEPGDYNTQKRLEVAQLSVALRSLAKELNCHVVLLSQLGRSVEERKPQVPRISDLKESGDLEQNADNVLLLYREEYYRKEETPLENRNSADIIIGKSRNGPTGIVRVAWHGETTSFRSLWRE